MSGTVVLASSMAAKTASIYDSFVIPVDKNEMGKAVESHGVIRSALIYSQGYVKILLCLLEFYQPSKKKLYPDFRIFLP